MGYSSTSTALEVLSPIYKSFYSSQQRRFDGRVIGAHSAGVKGATSRVQRQGIKVCSVIEFAFLLGYSR